MHYYAIFMHSACVHVHAHVCTLRLYMSLAYLSVYAATQVNRPSGISQATAIAVNRPSGISQAAAIAVNRTQGVKAFLLPLVSKPTKVHRRKKLIFGHHIFANKMMHNLLIWKVQHL